MRLGEKCSADEGEPLGYRQQMATEGSIRRASDAGQTPRGPHGVSRFDPGHLDPNGIQDPGHSCKDT